MNIIQVVLQSIYGPRFYREVRKGSLGSAMKYFFFLGLILMTAYSLYLSVSSVGYINSLLKSAPDMYPGNLEVKIHNGAVKTNAKEPYFIPMPGGSEEVKNIVVIDTKTAFNQDMFKKYDTLAWLTKDSIFFMDDDGGQVRALDLTEVKDFAVNKNFINGWITKIASYMPLIAVGIFVFFFIFLYIFFMFNLIPILFVAFIIWLCAKKMAHKLTYKQSYIVGIYVATGGLVLSTLLEIFAPGLSMPFMMIVLAVAIFLVNFSSEFKKSKKKK
jgi:hypothetical protein